MELKDWICLGLAVIIIPITCFVTIWKRAKKKYVCAWCGEVIEPRKGNYWRLLGNFSNEKCLLKCPKCGKIDVMAKKDDE